MMGLLGVILCACAISWQIDEAHAVRKKSSAKASSPGGQPSRPGSCAGVTVMFDKDVYKCRGPDGAELDLDSVCCREFVQCEEEAPTNANDYRKLFGMVMQGCSIRPSDYTHAGIVTNFKVSETLCNCDMEAVIGKLFKDTREGRRAIPGSKHDLDVFWLPQPFRPVCWDFKETSAKVKEASEFVRSLLNAFEARDKCPRICKDGEYPETCVVPFPPWAGSPALMPENCRGNLLVVQLPEKKEQYYVPLRVTSADIGELDVRRVKGSQSGDFVRVAQKGAMLELELVGKDSSTKLERTDKLELGFKGAKAPSDQYDPPMEKGESPFVKKDSLLGCVDKSYWSYMSSK